MFMGSQVRARLVAHFEFRDECFIEKISSLSLISGVTDDERSHPL